MGPLASLAAQRQLIGWTTAIDRVIWILGKLFSVFVVIIAPEFVV